MTIVYTCLTDSPAAKSASKIGLEMDRVKRRKFRKSASSIRLRSHTHDASLKWNTKDVCHHEILWKLQCLFVLAYRRNVFVEFKSTAVFSEMSIRLWFILRYKSICGWNSVRSFNGKYA